METKLKPNTWYWSADLVNWTEGSAPPELKNTARHQRTDEKGEWVKFSQVGETHRLP